MKLFVGLGNPEKKYFSTRHNIGFMCLDYLWPDEVWSENKKFKALVLEKGGDLYLKPLTYMNNSGEAVKAALDYYKLDPESDLFVIHDELDLDFGRHRLSRDSSSAGHRGVESIITLLKTKNFPRLRLGVKTPDLRTLISPENFVLQKFSPAEMKQLPDLFESVRSLIK